MRYKLIVQTLGHIEKGVFEKDGVLPGAINAGHRNGELIAGGKNKNLRRHIVGIRPVSREKVSQLHPKRVNTLHIFMGVLVSLAHRKGQRLGRVAVLEQTLIALTDQRHVRAWLVVYQQVFVGLTVALRGNT